MPRLFDGHAVQVDLGLDTVAATLQFAHGTSADVLAVEAQRGAIAMLDRVDVVLEALGQHLFLIGLGEPGFGLRFNLRIGRALLGLQRLGSLHSASKVVDVFLFHSRYSVRVFQANQGCARRIPEWKLYPRMKILVSNDDGYLATGINTLTDALEQVADVVVVAPDRNRSAASNSLTLSQPLRVTRVAENRYKVDGTPSDCVHVALTGFLDYEPDLVVSGINHGANLGDDVIYSGTVAAAMEGRFLGLPTIAVSLVGKTLVGAKLQHFDTAARVAVELVQKIERASLAHDTVLNVNVPDRPYEELAGIRATRLGFRHKSEQVLNDTDPYGRPIYWVGPAGEGQDAGEGTDFHAVEQGAVAVTPLKVDLTRHEMVPNIAAWLDR